MAERRMFAKKIIDSDAFISLTSACQALYLHLCLGSDDDGFNNQTLIAMAKAHASPDDLELLLTKHFIIKFQSGVIVIKDWRMSNAIRKDRYEKTIYQEEFQTLGIKEDGSYVLNGENTRLPNGCQMVAIGKDSTGKDSVGEDSVVQESVVQENVEEDSMVKGKTLSSTVQFIPPSVEEVKAYCEERKNDIEPEKFVDYYESRDWMLGKSKMKDWRATVRVWERNSFKNVKTKANDVGESSYDLDKFFEAAVSHGLED